MITDLFSHKIHSSGDEWPEKLIELACVFAEFDGHVYDRASIENRLQSISPRASLVSRDASKFRDEISAYPAYLGLYYLEWRNDTWIFRLSETTKRFLITEEPNVPAFLLLQLLLFQYPNGMGVAYHKSGLRIQANARDRTLQFIEDNVRICPLRLICKALLADSTLNGVDSLHPRVSKDEILILANDKRTNQSASPSLNSVIKVLQEAREGLLQPPEKYESRFHLLNHTDFIQITGTWVHLRETVSPEDELDLQRKFEAINNYEGEFEGFNGVSTEAELKRVLQGGEWAMYFDGLLTLSAETVRVLTNEALEESATTPTVEVETDENKAIDYGNIKFNYPLKARDEYQSPQIVQSRKKAFADPEVTKIKRQRSNLLHKILTQKMDEHLRNLGAIPYENEHIDIYAKIPNDGSYLFEVKSVSSDNLLSQTRKGLSQLYEYRYRYTGEIGEDPVLCLVYPKAPDEIEWLQEYLCNDRNIAVCWFDGDTLCYSKYCEEKVKSLIVA